jgi:phosphoribosylglycinamide formyltransferase-1
MSVASEQVRPQPLRLALLISGRGSNAMAILGAVASGKLSGCEVGVVVSNITGAPGIEAAKAAGVPVITLEGRGLDQRDHEEAVTALLRKFRIDLVCVAGYRRTLSASFALEWSGRILNLHASLLPAFPGHDPALQAFESGAQITGCTVFFVGETSTGPIVLQRALEIYGEDTHQTLSDRLRALQPELYLEAIERVIGGEYEARGKRYVRRHQAADESQQQRQG